MDEVRIEKKRIKVLNTAPMQKGDYILYWMQQSQRAEYNHALEYAVEIANYYGLPVVVLFTLMEDYPDANRRHYIFMLQGLIETRERLEKRGIQMVVKPGSPEDIVPGLAGKACALVCDRGYLRHQRRWRRQVAKKTPCRCIEVESDVVVPVGVVSQKAEYAAYTIRPKIKKHLDLFLKEVRHPDVEKVTHAVKDGGIDLDDYLKKLQTLKTTDQNVSEVSRFFTGGTSEAKKRFNTFIEKHLVDYDKNSNQPQTDDISRMGPYLHFGQISPLYLALKIQHAEGALKNAKEKFLEQLIVRRELSMNFVCYTTGYDTFECIPRWARNTLDDHLDDNRPYVYTRRQLEAAKTHDPYWNASMKEMKFTGYMHNYMRMYWGKKILEWSKTPKKAYETTLYLNNKYFLDGRDPNSFTGVAWIYGLHDRAWKEREIFGKIRYMAASGLERKCKISDYVEKVEALKP